MAETSGAGQGLTVERLAALLREADRECAWLGVEAYSMPDEWATTMASWLVPRLGSAAPSAPADEMFAVLHRGAISVIYPRRAQAEVYQSGFSHPEETAIKVVRVARAALQERTE